MSNIPSELKYSKSHEWLKAESDGTFILGISDHAQEQLGDMVYVELHEAGQKIEAEGECAVVESVKAASEVYSPIAGEVIDVNSALTDVPELINQDPYGKGWLIKIKASSPDDVAKLMDSAAYAEFIKAE